MNKKIGIVGLGLIGGSFAKASKNFCKHEIYGYDIDETTMQNAIKDKSIDGVLSKDMLSQMDLTIIALRPSLAIKFVEENSEIKGILLDICGIKEVVANKLLPLSKKRDFTYIGGHPMAGREVGGYKNCKSDLFKNASMILVPHENSIPKWLEEYFIELGFKSIIVSDDINHDRIIAFTSQLAHVVSNAFVKSETAIEHTGYSADSLKDLTRVATLDVDMWTELFLSNSKNLGQEISALILELEKYKTAIDTVNTEELKKLLIDGVNKKKMMYP